MRKPIIRKGSILSINNREFHVVGIWWLGLNPSRYELQEKTKGVNRGPMVIKEAKKILDMVEEKKIIVINN